MKTPQSQSYPFYIKFGSTFNIQDMYEKEYLYFSAQNGFRGPLEITGRKDPNEGNLSNLFFDKVSLTHKGKPANFNVASANINEFLFDDNVKLCSLFTFSVDQDGKKDQIDSRMISLGGSALAFHNFAKFYEMFKDSCKLFELKYNFKLVEYYDPKIPQKSLSLHQKDEYFDYQKESRLMLFRNEPGAFRLPIPGLQKVCKIFQSHEIEFLKLNIVE